MYDVWLSSKELEQLQTSVASKESELEEQKKMVNQLRKVGRKYKQQAEEAQKELEDVKGQKINQLQVCTISFFTRSYMLDICY